MSYLTQMWKNQLLCDAVIKTGSINTKVRHTLCFLFHLFCYPEHKQCVVMKVEFGIGDILSLF